MSMKSFACGDVVPGCEAAWVCSSEEDILFEVAKHASVAHGLREVPEPLLRAVRAAISPVRR